MQPSLNELAACTFVLRGRDLLTGRCDDLRFMCSAEKAEDVRRIGIYLGPVILASIFGNAVYGALFRTTAINIGGMPPFMNLMFAIIGAVIAWRMTDTLGSIAWTVFTYITRSKSCPHSGQLESVVLGVWDSSVSSQFWQLDPEHGTLLVAPC